MRRLLYVLLALALFGLLFPVYVFLPIIRQNPTLLQVGVLVLKYRGISELLIAAATLMILALRKTGIKTAVAVCVCALLVRVDPFEIFFHPIAGPSFGPVAESKLDGDERVIAVKLGSASRAYPIRNIGYHHIVNDRLDGVAIAATY